MFKYIKVNNPDRLHQTVVFITKQLFGKGTGVKFIESNEDERIYIFSVKKPDFEIISAKVREYEPGKYKITYE